MTYSRVKKYQELRDGLKEEAGLSRNKAAQNEQPAVEEDDFLSFMKKDEETNIEDTLTESKTFEQIRQEGSLELDKAIRSVRESVGKEDQYNTRIDILNKIRGNERIVFDTYDQYDTSEFSQGMFLKEQVKEPVQEMTLMEKLAAMSPKEDARKAQEFLEEEKLPQEEDVQEEVEEETSENIEETVQEEIEEPKTLGGKILDGIMVVLILAIVGLFGMLVFQQLF